MHPLPQGDTRPPPDGDTGIVQRKLSNGVRLNIRHTNNEPRAAMLRLVGAGGRACEGAGVAGGVAFWQCACRHSGASACGA